MGFKQRFEQGFQEGLDKQDAKVEVEALKKLPAGLRIVTINVVGNKVMGRFLNRGWQIMAHNPQSYGNWFNQYQMGIDREELENRLANSH